jgi:hypothetical protein
MDDDGHLDPADRLLIAGMIQFTSGLVSVGALEAALGGSAIVATGAVLGTVAGVALGPVFIAAGAYVAFAASQSQGTDILQAAQETNDAVTAGLKPTDYLEKKLLEKVGNGNDSLPADLGMIKAKSLGEFVKQAAPVVADWATDKVLTPPESTRNERSGNKPDSTSKSPTVDGPTCHPGDASDSGGPEESSVSVILD